MAQSQKSHSLSVALLFSILLSSCSTLNVLEDTYAERFASKGLNQAKTIPIYTEELQNIQAPVAKPVVAVYPTAFTDQTGQRKSNSEFAMFSTALTQQPNAILIKILKHAGNGNFFTVVDRVGLDNLTKERQLIRSVRDQLQTDGDAKKPLMPLLFAGVLFDGAVISYETNLVSGGIGSRYLGLGASTFYRSDSVTVSLRLVSVSTGEILIEATSSKTIYSYGSSQDIFKFIEAGTELVEFEVGNAENESSTVALQKAIESALLEIIVTGYDRSYWKYE